MPRPPDLRRRNSLWRLLRTAVPGSPAFEDAVRELSALTGWNRARVLAGLGLGESGSRPAPQQP